MASRFVIFFFFSFICFVVVVVTKLKNSCSLEHTILFKFYYVVQTSFEECSSMEKL